MQEITIKGIGETVYKETLDNGLEVYFWNSPLSHYFQGVLNVYYGGDDLDFKIKTKAYHVHRGSAHYLEHVMCEALDNEPVLSKFNKLGSHSNATTYNSHTSFEFSGTSNLIENIYLLFDTVFNKEFTDEMVEHERTPIAEEARMRCDDPDVKSYFKMNEMLFKNYPNNVELIGTQKDIKNITLEELKLIYDTFYQPTNMSFVLTGNFDNYEVLNKIKEYFKTHEITGGPKFKKVKYKEGKKVNLAHYTLKANNEIPEITICLKIPASLYKDIPNVKAILMFKLLLAINFGSSSELKEELLEKKLLYTLFFSVYKLNDYYIVELGSRTKYPEEIEKILVERLNNLKINESDVKRKIKSTMATLVLSYEDVSEVNFLISNNLVYENRIVDDEKELLESITLEELQQFYQKLPLKNMAVLYTIPKKKK